VSSAHLICASVPLTPTLVCPPSPHIPFPQQARVWQHSSAAPASGKENNATASQQEDEILLAALEMAENRHPSNVSACSSTALAARATYCAHTNTGTHNQTLAHSLTHSPGSYADSWQLGAKTADESHMDKSNVRSHALIAPEGGGGGGGEGGGRGEGTAYVPCKHARWQQLTHAQGHTPASTHIIQTPSARDLMRRSGMRKPLECLHPVPLECLHPHATLLPPPPGLQIAETYAIKEIGGGSSGVGGGEGGERGGEGGGGIRVGNGDVSTVSADGESKATDAQPPPPQPAWPQHGAPPSLHREPLSPTPAPLPLLPPPPVPPPGSPASSASSVLSRSLPKP